MATVAESSRLNLLDIGAIVTGASFASVHVRLTLPDPRGLPERAWGAVLLAWLTVTSAGPFFYLVRRFRTVPKHFYPLMGDRLWGLWGCPRVVAAIVGSGQRSVADHAGRLDPAYVGSLGIGLFLATIIAVPILASRYLRGTRHADSTNWTQWVGLTLTATWPLQCGVGLVVMG